MKRVEAALARARTDGKEAALGLIRRGERDGALTEASAGKLRLTFYRAMVAWADRQGGQGSETQGRPRDRRRRDAGSDAASSAPDAAAGRRAPRGPDHDRDRVHRANRRRSLLSAIEASDAPLAAAAGTLLDAVDALEERHEMAEAVKAFQAFFGAQESWEGLPGVVAQRLLSRAERFILAETAPAELWARLDDGVEDQTVPSALRERRRFRAALATRQASLPRFVSLGFNCMPWTLPNRWGLRPASDFFGLDAPFNLAVHRFEATLDLIRADFAGYTDIAEIRVVQTPNGHQVAHNPRYRAVWNHEKNAYWLDQDCAMLRHHLEQRIANFRQALAGEGPIAFLLSGPAFDGNADAADKTRALLGALRERTAATPIALICTSPQHGGAWDRIEIEPGLVHLRTPFPFAGYNWHGESDYCSAEGLAFERRYVEALLDATQQAGLVRQGR